MARDDGGGELAKGRRNGCFSRRAAKAARVGRDKGLGGGWAFASETLSTIYLPVHAAAVLCSVQHEGKGPDKIWLFEGPRIDQFHVCTRRIASVDA